MYRHSAKRIYDFLGIELTDEARSAMHDRLAENARHQHGSHSYRLEDFGLDCDQVDRELMFYRDRFAIPYETQPERDGRTSDVGRLTPDHGDKKVVGLNKRKRFRR